MKTSRRTVKNAAILIGLTSLCTLFLAGGNTIYEQVKVGRQRELRMSILRAFGESFTAQTFSATFGRMVTVDEHPKERATVYRYRGVPAQSAVLVSGPGLWGVIEMLGIFNLEKKTITEVRVMSQSETPGLGSRIEEAWFLNQFRNLSYTTAVRLVTQRSGASNEVDAITGATKTSQSVEAIINRAAVLAGGD